MRSMGEGVKAGGGGEGRWRGALREEPVVRAVNITYCNHCI